MTSMRKLIAWMLVFTLLVTTLGNTGFAQAATPAPGSTAVEGKADNPLPSPLDVSVFSRAGGAPLTWAQGAKRLCGLLGYIEEDASNIDLALYTGMISGLNAEDDSLYLGILAENGYLSGIGSAIDPQGIMPQADYERLLGSAFPDSVNSQEDAEKLTAAGDIKNLAVTGGKLHISALSADRIAIGKPDSVTFSGLKASALSVVGAAKVYLKAAELDRAVIHRAAGGETEKPATLLHVDDETRLPEIVIADAGDVTIEGNGALGMVRILGDAGTVTVRATCSVSNETNKEVTVTGPDGQTHILTPGGQADLVLTYYLVSFVTDGSPVASQTLDPGAALDFSAISTEKDGYVFTAWYEDAEFTAPYSTFSTVDGQLTLYARFIGEEDAATISFETFGGRALAPLVFAKGENLLCKPVSRLYTSKEGYSFGGWCTDEACTMPFGYMDAIEQSMTLYALFVSNEPESDEKGGDTAELNDIDWQAEIALAAPRGMTLKEVKPHVTVEAGAGALEPVLSFRETADGFAISGGYYTSGGKTGFEPGATFSIKSSGGVTFKGYDEGINTLVVSVYREETNVVQFADGLQYILWDHVLAYEPVVKHEGAEKEVATEPGSFVLNNAEPLTPGQIVVLFDGEINEDERNISSWTKGSFDGYVLFAQVVECAPDDGLMTVSFQYANPEDYLSAFDVHVTREVDIEGVLDEEQIACLEKSIASQVAANDELRAQMLVAVMTAPETQARLDELYGAGVYQLAGISASMKVNKPSVSLSVSGNSATVTISISATIQLKNGEEVILTITPSLTFEQKVAVSTNIDGGWLWIDVAAQLNSTSTIRLEITANSGEDSDMSTLNAAKSTLETLITPEGLDDSIDYMTSVNKLMTTMQSLIATELPYKDLFVVPLLTVKVSFHGIVTLTVNLDLVGQIGVLATFGIEIIVTNGVRIGFHYNFLKASGGSYTQKLPSEVRTQIYLIGKIGVRLGLRLTITLDLCAVAKVAITGELFAYAELTGMFFFAASLTTGSSTYVGALNFEVGLDASVSLSLTLNLVIKTLSKSWTVWKDRWPLYTKSWSSSLTIMDVDKLDEMWSLSTANADKKSVFGFTSIPMLTYSLMNGSCVKNELLWDSVKGGNVSLTLSLENLVIDGESIGAGDPRNGLFTVGDGSAGRSSGNIYLDESVAAAYLCNQSECDVVLIYQNTSASALVKKQSRRFHLSRSCAFSTTTVHVRFVMYDWCAHAWGIEAAQWDNALLYETQFESSHMVGGLCAPTETAQVDLSAIVQSASSRYPELSGMPLSWFDRTVSGTSGTVKYSVPRISNFCYMTPENGTVRYDVHPETYEYTLTWYLYANRFPGYKGEINYIVKLENPSSSAYGFSVSGSDTASPMHFAPDPSKPATWSMTALRSAFDGTDRPLLMSVDGAAAIETGLTLNGREPEETVVLSVEQQGCVLKILRGEGVSGYTIVSPAVASGDLVKSGTKITLSAQPRSGYRNVELISKPAGLRFTRADDRIMFTMPSHNVTVTLMAYRVSTIEYMYNLDGMGVYKTVYVAANEAISKPASPAIRGMTFQGWYASEDCTGEPYPFGGKTETNLTLYADWTCDVTVDFGGAAGQAVYMGADGLPELIFENDYTEYSRFTYSTLRVGDKLLDVMLPNYSGYDFMGWYLTPDFDGDPVDLETYLLQGGVTLYARWAKVVAIRYDWNYRDLGTYFEAPERLGWPMENVPDDPELDFHSFGGWYTSPACAPDTVFDPSVDRPAGDMVLYARWTADAFAIHYDLNGGVNSDQNPDFYTVDDGDITLAAPARTGYSFTGWIGEGMLDPLPIAVIPSGSHADLSFAAVWEPVVYTIEYDLVRGTVDPANPTQYTIESPDITLNNPVKEKYTFMGWTGTDLSGPTMEVIIPSGSIGNRSYKGTWHTDDPSSLIADHAIDAIADQYEYTIDEYVDGTEEGSSLYDSARAAVDSDESTAGYAQAIVLTLDRVADDPIESDTDYTYSFTATIVYTDDSGESLPRSKPVTVVVAKRQPEIVAMPTAGDLLYGQSLALSALTGGSAQYQDDGDTVPVNGAFAWGDDSVVPLGKDNGNAIYQVVFTPEDTHTYARAVLFAAVQTQIGVHVAVTADSRDYIKDTTNATGGYTLTDADTGDALAGVSLTGAVYSFAQATPGDNILVTCSGYDLLVPSGEEGLYALLNASATATASIWWITPVLTAPTASLTYGDVLRDVPLSGGSAKYGDIDVDGAWSWSTPSYEVLQAGLVSFTVVFTPQDTAGYRTGTAAVTIDVQKKAVAVPAVGSKTYSGQKQTADIDNTADYTVTENGGGTDAGTYNVVLTLVDADGCRWADGAISGADATLQFVITPATLTVNLSGASVMPLGYGQRLTSGARNGDLELPANDMIFGAQVTLDGTTVTGDWTWDVSGLTQPLNAGSYSVNASFAAISVNPGNFNAVARPFTVVVERAVPDLSQVVLTASSIYQSTPAQNSLYDSTITPTGSARNPVTGDAIAGTWEWQDPGTIPATSGTAYNVTFRPNATANYTNALSSASVSFRNFIYVRINQNNMGPGDVARIYDSSYNAHTTLRLENTPGNNITFTINLASIWLGPGVGYPVYLQMLSLSGRLGTADMSVTAYCDTDSQPYSITPVDVITMSNPTHTYITIGFTPGHVPASDLTINLSFQMDYSNPLSSGLSFAPMMLGAPDSSDDGEGADPLGGEETPQPTLEPPVEVTPQPTLEPPAEETPQPTAEPPAEETPQPTLEQPAEETPQPTAEPPADDTPQPTADPPAEETPQPTAEPPADATPQPTLEPPAEETPKPTLEPPADATPPPTGEEPPADENGDT